MSTLAARSLDCVQTQQDTSGADLRALLYASAAYRRLRRLRSENPMLVEELDALIGEIGKVIYAAAAQAR
jgi:hypothetical protein